MSVKSLREDLPVFAKHEGEWKGVYIHQDAEGNVIDKHNAHLIVNMNNEGDFPYVQTNKYSWDDGKKVEFQFEGSFKDGKIMFDNDRLVGHSWETEDDTIILTWTYKDDDSSFYYEMININEEANSRARIWHCFQEGELVKRVLIKEERVK